jgi:3-dehydrosphinganine reductase
VTHAIVTGGSSGIGLALVRRLVGAGHRVSVLALDDADLERLRGDPPPGPHRVRAEACDVTDRNQVEAAISGAIADQGPCGLLITCAGIVRPGRFLDLDPPEFERHVAVNYLGTLWPVRAVAPTMIARRAGSIAMVSSFAGVLGVYGYSAYAPTKYAVRGLAETLRTELKPHGVHVACVFPTDVDTPMLAAEEPLKPPELRALSGTARTQSADEVAAAILAGVARRRAWILCDRSSTFLARVAGAAPGVTRMIVDRTVAKAARRPGGALAGASDARAGGLTRTPGREQR